MKPHERTLAAQLTEQLARKLEARGNFADSPLERVSIHTQRGAPVKHSQLPKTPPGLVIEFPSPPDQPRLGYVHVQVHAGRVVLQNFLLERMRRQWHIGAKWSDRFVVPAQVLVAVHLGQAVPDAFVQQIADMY